MFVLNGWHATHILAAHVFSHNIIHARIFEELLEADKVLRRVAILREARQCERSLRQACIL